MLGERWTLLIIRELLLGPKRFTDLRERLDGISSSLLAERLARAEAVGLVRRSVLEPPAASTVYELTADGLALKPAVFELIRWGGRFLLPMRKGERIEPDWMRLVLAARARKDASPRRSFLVQVTGGRRAVVVHVAGGPTGTVVSDEAAPADATIAGPFPVLLALVRGSVNPQQAMAEKQVAVTGDPAALCDFPRLFDVVPPTADAEAGRPGGERGQG